jgi:hypothetical protein
MIEFTAVTGLRKNATEGELMFITLGQIFSVIEDAKR